ncbi:MAG TPA: ABC transporter substrate-binding protein, partial [Clostridia bacterium]|nr:ABC transporter substrate-binding protein [Clostridia bacterium]
MAQSQSAGASLNVAMVCSDDLRMMPLEVMERDPQTMLELVYESVVSLDDDRRPQGELAASWTQVGDGSTWIFTLHDGIYFHDGHKLTAHDVIATLNKIKALADEGKGLYRQTAKVLSGWEVDSELTFRVRAAQPNYMVLYAMTFPVLPQSAVDQECPPGTGPYRIEYYQPGGMFLLSGNQNWWKRAPYLQTITAYCYSKDSEALTAFQAETVDVLMTRSLTATRYRGIIGSTINSYDYTTQQLECLLFNNYASIFHSAEFRQALCHAIDKSRLATGLYQNIATTTDTLAMPGSYLYNSGTQVYYYNVQAANRLLDGLGYTKRDGEGYRYKETNGEAKTLELRLFYYDEPGSNLRKEAAGMIADMLAQVGIRVRTALYSFEDAKKKLNSGDYDLFLCAYNFGMIPDLDYLFGKDGNFARYSSKDMNALLKTLRSANEEAE